MKILKILNDNITNKINKKAGDWDDFAQIPDMADSVTNENNEKENPLCSDFWKYQVFNKPKVEHFLYGNNNSL